MEHSHIKVVLKVLNGSRTPPEDGFQEASGRIEFEGGRPSGVHVRDDSAQQQHRPAPPLVDGVQPWVVRQPRLVLE